MPNRIIRENILTSERVASLAWPEEVFYRRLMSVADDYGRFDGRAEILRARLYSLQLEKVSSPDVSSWLASCERAGLVRSYSLDGKPYIEILRFGQAIRSASKYPNPDNPCAQVRADAPVSVSESVCASPLTPQGGARLRPRDIRTAEKQRKDEAARKRKAEQEQKEREALKAKAVPYSKAKAMGLIAPLGAKP